jgi:hypothetical protein
MNQFEFQSCVNEDSTVSLPAEIAAQLTPTQTVHVLLLVPGPDEDVQWSKLTTEQFLAGYAESDAIYDELPEG